MSEGDLLLRVDPERIGASGIRTVLERCFDPDHRSLTYDRWFDECQHRAGMIGRGEVTPIFGIDAAVGSAVHGAAAADLLGEPDDVVRLLHAQIAANRIKPFPADVEAAEIKARRLFALWAARVRPRWLAVGIHAVEWELHFELAGAIYHVHPDVVLADGSVIDLKTSETRLGDGRVARDGQLTTYAYGVYRVFDHLPPAVGLDGLIYTNPPPDIRAVDPTAEKPWWDRQVGARTPDQFRAFEEAVARREAARRFARATGIYQTQAANGPEYVCRRCEARALCPAWRGTEWPDQRGSIANVA